MNEGYRLFLAFIRHDFIEPVKTNVVDVYLRSVLPSLFNKLKQKLKQIIPQNTPVSVQFGGQPPITTLNGLTLLHIAKANGVDISHYCGGVCSCGTCRVLIESGGSSLSRMTARESLVLGHSLSQKSYRLACQAKAVGPEIIIVKTPSTF